MRGSEPKIRRTVWIRDTFPTLSDDWAHDEASQSDTSPRTDIRLETARVARIDSRQVLLTNINREPLYRDFPTHAKGESAVARYLIGTSGWSYPNWRGSVYPHQLSRSAWLAHYAGLFNAVELNATFYRLPYENMLRGWDRNTPPSFRFAVKAWRMLTHRQRLADCGELLASFHARLDVLGDKAEAVLYQLPPNFVADADLLHDFLTRLPSRRRAAFECRDPSWHDPAIYAVLERFNAAFVPFELGAQASPRVVTADFVYVRLHGRGKRYHGNYDEAALQDWADWLRRHVAAGRDAYVFFDNTAEADHAVRNAQRLARLLSAE